MAAPPSDVAFVIYNKHSEALSKHNEALYASIFDALEN